MSFLPRCGECGSTAVRVLCWVDLDAGTYERASVPNNVWCTECEEHVDATDHDAWVPKPDRGDAVIGRLQATGLFERFMRQCEAAHVTAHDVAGRCRLAHVSAVRRAFWSDLRDMGWSYPAIGRLFDRHHATVMQGIRTHRATVPAEAAE